MGLKCNRHFVHDRWREAFIANEDDWVEGVRLCFERLALDWCEFVHVRSIRSDAIFGGRTRSARVTSLNGAK
jgi:hypothetical protein